MNVTLLDLTISCAIRDVIDHLAGRKNKSTNLHPFATRAIFSGTQGLTNRELLSILLPGAKDASGGLDKRMARHWRSLGQERTLKLDTIRGHCLALIRDQRVPNSDVVRGWTLALIHATALDWVRSAPDTLLASFQGADHFEASDLPGDAAQRIVQTLRVMLDEQYAAAEADLERGDARALVDTFLHYSAREVVAAMARHISPLRALEQLLRVVYPEIDRFGDPMEIDAAQGAVLASPAPC